METTGGSFQEIFTQLKETYNEARIGLINDPNWISELANSMQTPIPKDSNLRLIINSAKEKGSIEHQSKWTLIQNKSADFNHSTFKWIKQNMIQHNEKPQKEHLQTLNVDKSFFQKLQSTFNINFSYEEIHYFQELVNTYGDDMILIQDLYAYKNKQRSFHELQTLKYQILSIINSSDEFDFEVYQKCQQEINNLTMPMQQNDQKVELQKLLQQMDCSYYQINHHLQNNKFYEELFKTKDCQEDKQDINVAKQTSKQKEKNISQEIDKQIQKSISNSQSSQNTSFVTLRSKLNDFQMHQIKPSLQQEIQKLKIQISFPKQQIFNEYFLNRNAHTNHQLL